MAKAKNASLHPEYHFEDGSVQYGGNFQARSYEEAKEHSLERLPLKSLLSKRQTVKRIKWRSLDRKRGPADVRTGGYVADFDKHSVRDKDDD